MRGYLQGRFSFNVKGGRCEACSGDGTIKIEMNFLPDVYVPCEVCHGARYNRETLEVHYKGKTIAEVLDMPIEEAAEFFAAVPPIARHMKTLGEVGLGYVRLGQPATTLSGGEAQRVKLASELQKRSTGRTVYVLDEPTTGLHFEDIRKLLARPVRPGRQGQHRPGDRAQPRRHQDRRLAHRHGSRGRLARRLRRRRGHARRRSRPSRRATPARSSRRSSRAAARKQPGRPRRAAAAAAAAPGRTTATKKTRRRRRPRRRRPRRRRRRPRRPRPRRLRRRRRRARRPRRPIRFLTGPLASVPRHDRHQQTSRPVRLRRHRRRCPRPRRVRLRRLDGHRPATDPATSGSDSPSPSSEAGSDGTATPGGDALASAADVPVGGCFVVSGAKVVVTQPTEGDFKAFTAVCTHQGCLVESSTEGEIPCPCHAQQVLPRGRLAHLRAGDRRRWRRWRSPSTGTRSPWPEPVTAEPHRAIPGVGGRP